MANTIQGIGLPLAAPGLEVTAGGARGWPAAAARFRMPVIAAAPIPERGFGPLASACSAVEIGWTW